VLLPGAADETAFADTPRTLGYGPPDSVTTAEACRTDQSRHEPAGGRLPGHRRAGRDV